MGAITGTIAPNLYVSLSTRDYSSWYGAWTDSAGSYTISLVKPGDYVASFTVPGTSTTQYVPQTTSSEAATAFTVTAGAVTTISDTPLPTGTVSGRVLENNGSPAAGATISLEGIGDFQRTVAAADGGYRVTAVAGDYQIRLTSADGKRSQFFHQATTWAKAATVTVRAGQNTVVDETFLATGTVTVTATDAVTGARLTDFCVWVSNGDRSGCSNGADTLTLADVPVASDYYLNGYQEDYLNSQEVPVTVVAGRTTTVRLTLTPMSFIDATALDATTRQPVGNVCLQALEPRGDSIPDMQGWCTDELGKARIPYLAAGTYLIFAEPGDGVHGAQWVGPNGGTGDREAAAKVVVATGQTVQAPVIYLDRAGAITGTVTDAATGAPIEWVCVDTVALSAGHNRVGYCSGAETDALGRYTLTDLGPYQWPVEFTHPDFAWEWSGDAIDRAHAVPVTVVAGGTAVSDATLATGRTIRFAIVDQAGKPVTLNASATVVSAVTGEAIGELATSDTMFTRVLPQTVRVSYHAGYPVREFWYQGARDFDHATSVAVTDTDLDLTLVVTDQWPSGWFAQLQPERLPVRLGRAGQP
jgi:hypothetical protein